MREDKDKRKQIKKCVGKDSGDGKVEGRQDEETNKKCDGKESGSKVEC